LGLEDGHRNAPFAEIHDLIKSLQPEILIVDHDGIQAPGTLIW